MKRQIKTREQKRKKPKHLLRVGFWYQLGDWVDHMASEGRTAGVSDNEEDEGMIYIETWA